jgi:hypothetical protein
MSNMQVFYRKIKATKLKETNPYLSNMEKLTHLNVAELQSTVSDLWWNEWESPTPAANGLY